MRIVNIVRHGALVVSTKIMSPGDAMLTVSNYRNNVKIRMASSLQNYICGIIGTFPCLCLLSNLSYCPSMYYKV